MQIQLRQERSDFFGAALGPLPAKQVIDFFLEQALNELLPELGEEIIIARGQHPAVKLTPVKPPVKREFGLYRGIATVGRSSSSHFRMRSFAPGKASSRGAKDAYLHASGRDERATA